MMRAIVKPFLVAALVSPLFLQACSGGGGEGLFSQPSVVAIDSANDRIFVLENARRIFSLDALDLDEIGGDQPLVNDDRNEDIYDLLPQAPLHAAVYADGTASRLFIAGSIEDEDGQNVLNRLLVLDFDGTTLSVSEDSPISLSDGDSGTDDTLNTPGDLLVDQSSARLYVTDSTTGQLHVLSAEDGSLVRAPLTIAGAPNKMSLAGDHLFVANASDDAAERVVTVVDTTDFSTSTFDLEVPLTDIAALEVGNEFALLAKDATANRVLIRSVSADFATVAEVPSANDEAGDGELAPASGLTSAAGGVLLATDANGDPFGYVPQADGNIELLTFTSDLSAFTAEALSTVTEVMRNPEVYVDGDGNGLIVYTPAQSSGDLVFTDVGSDEVEVRF